MTLCSEITAISPYISTVPEGDQWYDIDADLRSFLFSGLTSEKYGYSVCHLSSDNLQQKLASTGRKRVIYAHQNDMSLIPLDTHSSCEAEPFE